jgi:hypothetical protein
MLEVGVMGGRARDVAVEEDAELQGSLRYESDVVLMYSLRTSLCQLGAQPGA